MPIPIIPRNYTNSQLTSSINSLDPNGSAINPDLFNLGNDFPGPISADFNNANQQFPTSDQYIKTFMTSKGTVSIGNGITSIDDPTYLGFSLEFDPNSPLFFGAAQYAVKAFAPLIGYSLGPTLSESAIEYLIKNGDGARAEYLSSFINGLTTINTTRPYYWQTVEGLSEAWNKTFNIEDPYSGSNDTEGITIGCLEALDLKITSIFNLYKTAVFDVKYKRMVLPKNLMYFNVALNVLEIRKFKRVISALNTDNFSEEQKKRIINENTAMIKFNFEDCLWDLTSSGNVFSGVTNAGGNDMINTSMKWSYGRVYMESQFPGFPNMLSDNSNTKNSKANELLTDEGDANVSKSKKIDKKIIDNASRAATEEGRRISANLQRGLLSRVSSEVNSRIKSTLLGNVFGLRNQTLSAIQNPQILNNAILGAFNPNNRNNQNQSNSTNINNNIFSGNNLSTGDSLSPSNIFGPKPSGPPPLSPNNVFGR